MEYGKLRVMISGGGTGGHIFPAVSIANRLKEVNPETEILFVGARGRMEMEKVPAAGYEIKALDIAGLKRSLSLSNLALPFKLIKSVLKAREMIRSFKPDIVIGVGGYASAPLLFAASLMGLPTLLQEQNGFAGLTNKLLGRRAKRICVAYEGMERFFPADRIVITGNPIRKGIVKATGEMRSEGMAFYGLSPERKHIFIVGGSLGSRTLNETMMKWIDEGCKGLENSEIIWQCGKYYKKDVDAFMEEARRKGKGGEMLSHIQYHDFIQRMDLVYAASDIVVSRSGAGSISELCAAGKACIFVPSPNVTEDHQTHNAMALVRKDAAILVKDAECREKLIPVVAGLASDPGKIEEMERNILGLALPDAAKSIVDEVYKVLEK